jgi:hypothetical protein
MSNLKVTPELLGQVREVLDMAAKGRYSTSKVYAVYNTVTGKNDPPQTCPSCLRNRVKLVRAWYEKQVLAPEPNLQVFDLLEHDRIINQAVDPIGTSDGDTAPPQGEERPDDLGQGTRHEALIPPTSGMPIDVICLHVPVLELPVYFEPGDKDPNKGKAYYQGGGSIKPGKYVTSDDRELAVQPGGKATLKAAPDNDLL